MSSNPIPIWREEACIPRREVIEGTLTDAELALSLSAVAWGRAKSPYNDPVAFFQSTHLTSSMKTIVESVLGRLSRSRTDVNPIMVLDVGFGGGKTHTLVTIFYAAKHPLEAQKYLLKDLKQPTKVKVVAISGDEYGSEGVERDGVKIKTIWGDLFWQLGVYQKFSKLDKDALIPSLDDIRTAIRGNPTLVLIDELPTYFKLLASEGSVDKAVQFIQRLVIAVSEIEDAALLLAIAEDVYKSEADRARKAISEAVEEAVAETRAHIRRKETVLVPVAEEDVVHILKRRLFEKISEVQAVTTSDAYHQLYSRLAVPDKWKSSEFKNSIQENYPFHPELIRVLYERVSTIDKFNRTRGAIRLLSRVIRRVWKEKEGDALLVHPFHVDLADQGILDDLTTGLGEERRRNAAEADIWSSKGGATAQELDNQSQAHWGAPLVRRACNTIYLYSLAAGREGAQGIASEALTALCTTPQRPDHYMRIRDTVLTFLLDSFQFIDRRGERYVFVKEPTPSRVIEQLSRDITEDESLKTISEKLGELYSGDPEWLSVELFPSNPAKIPDQPYCVLAILNPSLHTAQSGARKPSDDVAKFLIYKDESGKKLRQFFNSTFLLVASSDRLESLRLAARRLKAARMVQEDLLKFNIPKDRKSDVAEYEARQEKNVNDYLRAAFCNLVYFERQGPSIKTISSNGYGSAKGGKEVIAHQLVNVVNRVKEEALDPSYVFEYAWPKGAGKISVKSMYEQFNSVPGLIIPSTKEIFQKTVKRGLDEGSWILKLGDTTFTHEKLPTVIPIDEKSELHTLAEAEKIGLLKQQETKIAVFEQSSAPGARQEFINSLVLADAPLEALADDLAKRGRRDKFDHISTITLKMSEADQMNLINIKNLFTRLFPEKDISARLEATLQRPRLPKFTLTIDVTKEDTSQEEGKNLFDVAWKLKGTEYCDMTLILEWENGSTPEQVADLIRSLAKDSKNHIVASLEARVGRKGAPS
ncbi:MAG TPA: DUF499 domain-containing protein [Nitrososphaerales archaeon]|nr:DUF499 domain-containing protein [Nitrososphaerales archaeon]